MERRERDQTDTMDAGAFQQAVFNATPDTIAVWDLPSSSVVWANRSITELLGYTTETGAAMRVDLPAHLVVAEDRDKFAASLAAVRDALDGEVVSVDFRMRHRDGTDRWFSRRVAPLRRDADGAVTQIVGISRDTTEFMVAAAALRHSEERFRQLADSVDVAFLLRSWDPPRFLYVSPAYEKIFGYDPVAIDETPDGSLLRVHPDDRRRFVADYWVPSEQGAPAVAEYRIVRPDGEIRWVKAKTAPVPDSPGNLRRSASTVEDITAARLADAAIQSAKAATEANEAKNDYLSRMSHELRTPLNAVLGFAQLLEMDELTEEQHDAVLHIIRGGQHLVGLIDDVLEISKIEGDHLEMTLDLVPISELLDHTVDLMKPAAAAADVTLHYRPNPSARRPVRADHRRLRQVVLNLLSNAIKYNRPGGRVDISCSIGDEARLDIGVKDTGQGICPEDLGRLFVPFERLGAEATGVEGTGVGLALSQRLMTLMGGTLTATSEAGVGSSFVASIPLTDEQWEEPDPGTDAPTVVSGPDDAAAVSLTVVYVEDLTSNVELIERLVARRPQWKLVVAGRGGLALELIDHDPPDLVLLDLHLPDMSGVDILRRLRSGVRTRDLMVIVVGTFANSGEVQRLLSDGADAYLTQPLVVDRVLELLDAAASRASAK